MRNHKTPKGGPFVGNVRRLMAVSILLATAVLSVGVVAAISKQKSNAQESKVPSAQTASARKSFLGNRGVAANQTAQVRPLTQEEAQKLAAALKAMANQNTDGLRSVQHSDGSVSMDLEGRFQNVAIAKRNEDGTVAQSCVDNPAAGAAFFGLDPALVGLESKAGSRAPRKSSANK